MYQLDYENSTPCRVAVIIDLVEFLRDAPGFFAWSDILSLPRSEIMKVVCHIADVIPIGFQPNSVDYYPIMDSFRQSIYYIFDDNPTVIPRPIFVDEEYQNKVSRFEDEVIDLAFQLRNRLPASVVFIRFVAFIPGNAFMIEVEYQ
jgi:hypothetical protein|tara:strand:- start:7694 stop:8131 length:438 start_codon:yes stop_codon:yes gene_type:complete